MFMNTIFMILRTVVPLLYLQGRGKLNYFTQAWWSQCIVLSTFYLWDAGVDII